LADYDYTISLVTSFERSLFRIHKAKRTDERSNPRQLYLLNETWCADSQGSQNVDLRNKTYVPVFYRGNKIWVRVRVR